MHALVYANKNWGPMKLQIQPWASLAQSHMKGYAQRI